LAHPGVPKNTRVLLSKPPAAVIAGALICLAIVLPARLRAQAAPPPPGSTEEPAATAADVYRDETTVADKKVENPHKVGVAVTPFGDDEVERLEWRKPAEVAAHVPNTIVKESFGNANPIFVIRGVGLNDFNANSSPSTGFYLDEVPLVAPLMMGFQLFDVEHVEVLKGPQGTLYGRNTTAGAINVLTRRPSATREGFLRLGAERYRTGEVEAMAGGAVSRGLAGRVAVDLRQSSDGPFYNRTYAERRGALDVLGWRAGLDWAPGAAARPVGEGGSTSVRMSLHGSRDRSQGYQYEHLGFIDPASGGPCAAFLAGEVDPLQCVDLAGYSDADGDPFSGDWNLRPRNHLATLGGVVTLAGTGRRLEVTAITGWQRLDRRQSLDADASPDVGLDMHFETDLEQASQEVRIRGLQPLQMRGGAATMSWLLGLFAGRDELSGQPNQRFVLDEWLRTRAETRWDQDTTSFALFGSTEWAVGRLVLTAGGRYTREEKHFRGSTTDLNPFGTSCLLSPVCAPGFVGPVTLSATDRRLTADELSGDLRLEHFPRQDLMLFASVRRGFKSGGFNGGFAASDFELAPYDDEIVIAYEGGAKLERRRFTVGLAGFFYDYSGLQLFAVRTNASGLPTVVLTNASDARIRGLELEARWRPVDGLDVRLGTGLLDTELVDFESVGRDLSGNELPNAPHREHDLLIAYSRPLGGSDALRAATLSFATDYSYTAATYKEPTNHPVFRAEGFGLLGARIAVERRGHGVAVWGKNLTDERYLIDVFDQSAIGQGLRIYGWPRTYGVSLTLRR
jgi:iron complex outermembrane recepter protein